MRGGLAGAESIPREFSNCTGSLGSSAPNTILVIKVEHQSYTKDSTVMGRGIWSMGRQIRTNLNLMISYQ